MKHTPSVDDNYSDAEAARRRDAIVKNMIATPPQKHAPLKTKKRKAAKKVAKKK